MGVGQETASAGLRLGGVQFGKGAGGVVLDPDKQRLPTRTS